MTVLDREFTLEEIEAVGDGFGALPVAPMVMPEQVLERGAGLRARIAALVPVSFGTRKAGH